MLVHIICGFSFNLFYLNHMMNKIRVYQWKAMLICSFTFAVPTVSFLIVFDLLSGSFVLTSLGSWIYWQTKRMFAYHWNGF